MPRGVCIVKHAERSSLGVRPIQVVRPLDRLIGAAAAMMHEGGGAYLHHYAKHGALVNRMHSNVLQCQVHANLSAICLSGVERDAFDEALATAEQILHDYRQL